MSAPRSLPSVLSCSWPGDRVSSYNYTAVGPGPDQGGRPPTPGLQAHRRRGLESCTLCTHHNTHFCGPTAITSSSPPSLLNHGNRQEANRNAFSSTACLTRGGDCGYPEQSGAAGPSSSMPDASTGSALRCTVLSAESTNPRSSSPANSGSSSPANPFNSLPMAMSHRALERFNRCLSLHSYFCPFCEEWQLIVVLLYRSYHPKHLQPDLCAQKLRLGMVCKIPRQYQSGGNANQTGSVALLWFCPTRAHSELLCCRRP